VDWFGLSKPGLCLNWFCAWNFRKATWWTFDRFPSILPLGILVDHTERKWQIAIRSNCSNKSVYRKDRCLAGQLDAFVETMAWDISSAWNARKMGDKEKKRLERWKNAHLIMKSIGLLPWQKRTKTSDPWKSIAAVEERKYRISSSKGKSTIDAWQADILGRVAVIKPSALIQTISVGTGNWNSFCDGYRDHCSHLGAATVLYTNENLSC